MVSRKSASTAWEGAKKSSCQALSSDQQRLRTLLRRSFTAASSGWRTVPTRPKVSTRPETTASQLSQDKSASSCRKFSVKHGARPFSILGYCAISWSAAWNFSICRVRKRRNSERRYAPQGVSAASP